MDISYNCENQKFNYRVCAMIIAENKILAMHDERSPYAIIKSDKILLFKRFLRNFPVALLVSKIRDRFLLSERRNHYGNL